MGQRPIQQKVFLQKLLWHEQEQGCSLHHRFKSIYLLTFRDLPGTGPGSVFSAVSVRLVRQMCFRVIKGMRG